MRLLICNNRGWGTGGAVVVRGGSGVEAVAPMAEVQWRSDGGLGNTQRNGHNSRLHTPFPSHSTKFPQET